MSDLLGNIRRAINAECQARRCRHGQSSLALPKQNAAHILLTLDCAAIAAKLHGQRCDFLFIDENARVAAVELKKGQPNMTQAHAQLQGGATFAESLTSWPKQVEFVPVVTGSGMAAMQVRALREKHQPVRFLGRKYPLRFAKNGSLVTDVFRER